MELRRLRGPEHERNSSTTAGLAAVPGWVPRGRGTRGRRTPRGSRRGESAGERRQLASVLERAFSPRAGGAVARLGAGGGPAVPARYREPERARLRAQPG